MALINQIADREAAEFIAVLRGNNANVRVTAA